MAKIALSAGIKTTKYFFCSLKPTSLVGFSPLKTNTQAYFGPPYELKKATKLTQSVDIIKLFIFICDNIS